MSKFQADSKLDRPITLQVSPSPSSKFFPRTPFVNPPLHCKVRAMLWGQGFRLKSRFSKPTSLSWSSKHLNAIISQPLTKWKLFTLHCIVVKNIIMVISGADIWRQCLEINIWTLQIPPPADFENKNIKLKSNWDYRHFNSVMVSWLYWCDPSEWSRRCNKCLFDHLGGAQKVVSFSHWYGPPQQKINGPWSFMGL